MAAGAVRGTPGTLFFVALLPLVLLPAAAGGDALARRAGISRMALATSAGAMIAAAWIAASATPTLLYFASFQPLEPGWESQLLSMVFRTMAALAIGLLALALPRAAVRRRLLSFSGPVALLSCIVATGLFGFALVRAASRPDIARYKENLPHIWLNPPGTPRPTPPSARRVGPIPTTWVPQGEPPNIPGPPGVRTQQREGLTFIQDCDIAGCTIGMSSSSAEAAPRRSSLVQDWNDILHLWIDERNGAVYVQREALNAYIRMDGVTYVFERTAEGWVPGALDPQRVIARTSAPTVWILVSGLLLAVSVIQWLLRRRAMAHLRALDGARSGFLGEDGVVRFGDDFPPLTLSTPTETQAGPVTVVFGPFAKGERLPSLGTIHGEWVFEGNIDALREEALLQMLGRDSSILAVASLAMAPLIAAATVGLLF